MALILFVGSVWIWLQLNVKAIDVDDSELIEYLNAFMQYEDAAEVQMQTETSEMPSPETEVPEPAAKVPEALKTLLSEHFLDGTIAETLEAMMSDVVVAKEEYEKYRGCGIDLDLSHLEEYGGALLRVDADNDGIEDLFLWIDDGGSMGNSTFIWQKGRQTETMR